MTPDDSEIELRSDSCNTRSSSAEQNSEEQGATSLPPIDGGRQANLVLLGCGLLQLPTWGFAVSYGVFQEFYTSNRSPISSSSHRQNAASLGVVGTTLNGIIYLSMPVLFGLFTRRLIHRRKQFLTLGVLLSALSLLASAWGEQVWQLIVTQSVLQGAGATLLYSASTIYLDEWFIKRKGFAYGAVLSVKSAVGVTAPLMLSAMLSHIGYRGTLFIWSGIVLVMSLPALFLLRLRNPAMAQKGTEVRSRRLAWTFLRHPTFYIFAIANVVFSASYGMPQTYLSTFASKVLHFNSSSAALMLAALNVPSIAANIWFGLLSDGGPSKVFCGRRLSVSQVSFLSAMGSCFPVFLLWGLVPPPSEGHGSTSAMSGAIALLALFAVVYGFFSGGYSATWAGVVKEISKEGESCNEAVDTGLVYGLMNGARGVGFVTGGLAGVELLKVGAVSERLAYGTSFGSLIVFTGCGAGLSGIFAVCRGFKR